MESRNLTQQAMSLHQSGKLDQAKRLYLEAIKLDSENSDAHQFLGLLQFQSGHVDDAIARIKQAITINPNVAPYFDNLGVVQEAAGQYQDSMHSYSLAAKIDKENPDRHFNMAIVLEKLGREMEAETAYNAAIRLKPEDGASHFNLGNLLKGQGKLDAAINCFQDSAKCNPMVPGVLNNLGNCFLQRGRLDDAINAFKRSLTVHPQESTALLNLAISYIEAGKLDLGKDNLTQFSVRFPNSVKAHSTKGRLEYIRCNQQAAVSAYSTALKLDPTDQIARSGLVEVFNRHSPSEYIPDVVRLLLLLFDDDQIKHQSIARLAANQIRHWIANECETSGLEDLAGNPLLIALLSKSLNTDAELETLIKHWRWNLVKHIVNNDTFTSTLESLCTAIGIQCFANEYLYSVDDEQSSVLNQLENQISASQEAEQFLDVQNRHRLAALSMYKPLWASPWAGFLGNIDRAGHPDLFCLLIDRSIIEISEEQQLKSTISTLGEIADSISSAVREQYEQNPYPRWFNLPLKSSKTYYQILKNQFPHFSPPQFLDQPVSVLNAGCGTGQEAAMIAQSKEVNEVIGLDLSMTSLAHGLRMKNKLGISDLSYVQGDILDCKKLGKEFSVIESSGVLHHMENPLSGWRELMDCLVPGGVMKIGLYSALSSVEVNQAQLMIQKQNLAADEVAIRQVREDILNSPQSDSLYPLRYSDDFYAISACRDLLFHVQEHSYTTLQLKEMLDQLDLTFIGFELSSAQIKTMFQQQFPDDSAMLNLENWHVYEQSHPETFTAMYNFWCQKTQREI